MSPQIMPAGFAQIGQSAQSLLALSAVTLMAVADDAFILICRTSFAPYVQRWLADAALEYGYQYIAYAAVTSVTANQSRIRLPAV